MICPGCGRSIGLMADMKGTPTTFLCPHSKQVVGPQDPPARQVRSKGKRFNKKAAQAAQVPMLIAVVVTIWIATMIYVYLAVTS